ncbi:MAG: chemotaxis protein CheW [Gemmatimonadales bacterium]
MNIVLIQVRGSRFGIPAASVVELIRAVAVSPLPGAPKVVSGVINVRGSLTAVIDPAVVFGHPEVPVKSSDNFVLVSIPSRTVGLRVESADELVEIADADIQAASSVSSSAHRLGGVATLPDGLLVIYDPAKFLDEAEGIALADALASASASV